jgi:hypothetical protein
MVTAGIHKADGTLYSEVFLIDTGADTTVLSAAVFQHLNLAPVPLPPGYNLVGISGTAGGVLVSTAVEFTRADGGTALVRGNFAAFLNPSATDYSILGRDVLDNFDIIVSRRWDQILLLASNHRYQVFGP